MACYDITLFDMIRMLISTGNPFWVKVSDVEFPSIGVALGLGDVVGINGTLPRDFLHRAQLIAPVSLIAFTLT